jgi:hypothetical protein
MNKSYEELLHSFKLLWTNRKFDDSRDSETLMRLVILMDLKDELSHPRARSTPNQKYVLAVKRINQSTIPAKDQVQIIQLYKEVLDGLI